MKNIFSEHSGEAFTLFGTSHFIALFIYFTGIILLFKFFRSISSNQRPFTIMRWGLFGLLIVSEPSYQIYAALNGIWSISDHMFLHLCGIAGITGAIALITHNQQLIQITFFIGLLPAFFALLTPDLSYEFPHFRFWKFFIHHMTISWTSLFLIIFNQTHMTFQSFLKTYCLLLLYAAFIGFLINPLLDSNYLYLSNAPAANTPLDLLGNNLWYYVNLSSLAFIILLIQYQVYKLFRNKMKY